MERKQVDTITIKHFSQFPSDRNYSELYEKMTVERIDDCIVTTFKSRINNHYNRVIKIPLNEVKK